MEGRGDNTGGYEEEDWLEQLKAVKVWQLMK